jgi:2-amino-4-hydroxy-6-hydroxymethyldihydropteridine diphosphokinase
VADQHYFLLLGSNQGDRLVYIREATSVIHERIGTIEKSSSVYQTAAWGKTDQPDFLNQTLIVKSALAPEIVLDTIHSIELEMGRIRTDKWSERSIDIDILYIDDLIINQPELKVPHPEIQNRRFTLVALAEIAADFIHPVLKKSNADILQDCIDHLEVKLFKD